MVKSNIYLIISNIMEVNKGMVDVVIDVLIIDVSTFNRC